MASLKETSQIWLGMLTDHVVFLDVPNITAFEF